MPAKNDNYKKVATDVTTVVNNGSATTNDLVVAVTTIYDYLWAVGDVDRDAMQTQLPGLLTRAKVGAAGVRRTPGGAIIRI